MDVSQYLEIFIDESEEHLQTLSDCIMVLEKEPDNKDTINEVFRAGLLVHCRHCQRTHPFVAARACG